MVHLRDVIKAFMKGIKWSFTLSSSEYDKIKDELTIFLKGMNNGQNSEKKVGVEIILDIVKKCTSVEIKGNDEGHYINNIGFDEKYYLKILENYLNAIKGKTII